MALDVGINSSFFWDMTILEITDFIESYERVEIRRQKQKVIDNQILVDQLIRGFNIIMNGNENGQGDNSIKQIWDYYPELFKEEKIFFEEQKEKNDFENFKARRQKFANQYNKKFRGGGD